MTRSEVKEFLPEIIKNDVSEVARGNDGFTTLYLSGKLTPEMEKKRKSFISRSYASYKINPTYRRKLSLIAWAFNP